MKSAATETVPCPIAHWAAQDPHAAAIVAPEQRLDYATLARHVEATAAAALGAGFNAGDVVAIAATPYPDTLVGLLGLLHAGMAVCPVNPGWPEAYTAGVLGQVGCQEVLPLEFLHGGSDLPASASFPMPIRRPAVVILTSGSTGAPKAAVLSYGNLYYSAFFSNRNIALAAADAWLLSLPLYHVSGLGILFRCLLAGATVVLPEDGRDLETALQDKAVSHVSLVGTQLARLLDSPRGTVALQRLKAILLGGSAIPENLIRCGQAAGLQLHTTYGMTETASQATTSRSNAPLEELLTSGKLLHPDALRISDAGEIEVNGPTLFLGYLEEEGLHRPSTSDGFFATGDTGFLDNAGNLHVTGRRDNLFIVGGENVQPEEVERVLEAVEGVEAAAVVPVPDPVFGHVPVAFVRLGALDEHALLEVLRARLPRHKVPRAIYPWPEDAKAGLKLDRQWLQARARALWEA